jgi:phosphoglycerate dehydrogenase-like enzyme
MTSSTPIAVTSRSFSRHPVLRAELQSRYSNVRFNDRGVSLSGQELIEFCKGRSKLITALETIDETFLAALPKLEVVGKYGVGTDMLDKQAMIRHDVELGWTGGVNKRSVTELTVAFMISLLRLVPLANRDVCNGIWKTRKGRYLSSCTVGIIGCGHIGKDLTSILKAFGCTVLAYDILDFPDFYREYGVEAVALENLLQRADVVTLHVPLNDSTRNILSSERLAMLKAGAILINTARGGLVDEHALKSMLREQRLSGAAFDVFATEPPEDLDLVNLPNFLCTPHIGGSADEAILAMGRAAIDGLDNHALPSDDYPPAN